MKEGRRFWDDVNGGYLPEDLVLAARREEIDWVHSEGVYEIVPMQECKDASMKPLDLIWVDTESLWTQHTRKFDRGCVQENTRREKQGKIHRALPASQLFSGMPPLEAVKVLVSIMMSVSLSNKETIEVETLRHQQSTFPRTSPETHLNQTSAEGPSEVWRRQSSQIGQEHVWNSRRFPHLATCFL